MKAIMLATLTVAVGAGLLTDSVQHGVGLGMLVVGWCWLHAICTDEARTK